MGVSFSCLFAEKDDVEAALDSRRDEEYSSTHDLEVVKWLSRNPFTSNGFSAQHIDIVVRWGEEGHEAAPKKKLGRPPASQRLGPSNPKKKVSTEEGTGAKPTERKKLGHPPSKRVVQQSPKLIRGSISLKRKGQKDNTPHCRKKLITSGSRATN
ncbi:hypothetical protein DY000_02038277 [Brassica cretica]|uniref:Uncharacterized protein n=1 Tax=Brassica cretica TaxID=69181 RepID=A0ABQ7B5Y9_BRACR|nr:hypothetical protein DY000_02038277 [Brassica cretica]